MVAAAALLAATGSAAHAADADLQSLQQQIDKLQQQIQSIQAASPASTATANPPSAAPAPYGQPVVPVNQPGFLFQNGAFKVPGTNTMLKIGGFAKLDVTYDADGGLGAAGAQSFAINKTSLVAPNLGASGSAAASSTATAATSANVTSPNTASTAGFALPGTPEARQTGRFQMDARTSRFNLETRTPTEYGEVKFYIESEFRGGNVDGNASNSNSSTLRLRQAYGTVGNLVAGQTWSLWEDRATIPNSIDLTGPAGVESGVRQAVLQYRWDIDPAQKHQIYVGIENPYNDYSGADKETFITAGANEPTDNTTKAPDVLVKYAVNGSWGRWSNAFLMRYLEVDNVGNQATYGLLTPARAHSSTIGYGLSTGPKIFTGLGNEKNAFLFRLTGGEGIGRYMNSTQTPSAIVDNQGKLRGQLVAGYNVNYQHWFADNVQANLIYGEQHTWNKGACQAGATAATVGCDQSATALVKTVEELEANVFYIVNPYVTFGAAYIYANAEVAGAVNLSSVTGATRAWSGTTAHDNRFQFSTIIGF
jgi:hypothetical protein